MADRERSSALTLTVEEAAACLGISRNSATRPCGGGRFRHPNRRADCDPPPAVLRLDGRRRDAWRRPDTWQVPRDSPNWIRLSSWALAGTCLVQHPGAPTPRRIRWRCSWTSL